MYKRIYLGYVFFILSGIFFTHIIFSYFLAFSASHLYRNFIMDVRNLDYSYDERFGLSRAYLGSTIRSSKKPIILILGTSFSYGYHLLAKEAYSSLLEKHFPKNFIMNASVIGDNGENLLDQINYLRKNKLKVDKLIIEINIFNLTTTKKMVHFSKNMLDDNSGLLTPPEFKQTYYYFYLRYPHGFHSIINLDVNRLFFLGKNSESSFSFSPLPDTYAKTYQQFKKDFPRYRDFIETLLAAASEVSNNVYFYISPIYSDGMKRTQFNFNDIKHEVSDVYSVCRAQPKINCINPGFQFSEANFLNISHFNQAGHRAMAVWLSKELLSAKRSR